MTVNYTHTSEIIPKVINGNKELFLNEIMSSKENLKYFLEHDTYLKACEKLNIESSNLLLEEIEERKYENGQLIFISFFDNYMNDQDDSKNIVFVTYKGNLRYFRFDLKNYLYEINLDYINEEVVAKLDTFDKEKIISYILEFLSIKVVKVPVGISNRHVHLKKEDLEKLFGQGFELEVDRELSQKGQFASKQRVTIKTENGIFENVRVLGPVRSYTQIEISKTDAYKLKLNPPVRDSGDLVSSEVITIIGPKGEITTNGCIIANRHIHLTENDLAKYGLDKNKTYKVKVNGEKGGILDNIHLKVDESFTFELHLDTDDANAFLIKSGEELEIIK